MASRAERQFAASLQMTGDGLHVPNADCDFKIHNNYNNTKLVNKQPSA